jgi:hypothetical protein
MQVFTKKPIVICTIQIEQIFDKTHINSYYWCMVILLVTKSIHQAKGQKNKLFNFIKKF